MGDGLYSYFFADTSMTCTSWSALGIFASRAKPPLTVSPPSKSKNAIRNGWLIGGSLHHDGAGHFGVDGAEVRISSGFAEGKGELFVGIQHLGLEYFVGADNGVGNIVTIGPGDRGSDGHRQR